jgi:hypothetical protein
MSIVSVGGESTAPAPEENEVVIYRSFLKAGLWFPLRRCQGLEPSAKCFCNMHKLLYETKATGKEQYHNNFCCYGFIARLNASYLVPTYRKRWLGA